MPIQAWTAVARIGSAGKRWPRRFWKWVVRLKRPPIFSGTLRTTPYGRGEMFV